MHRRPIALIAALCSGLALLLAPVAAGATTAPSVTLLGSQQISATGKATFGYHAEHLASGSRLLLQVSDEGHWVELARSGTHSGTANGTFHVDGPGEPGRFTMRAAVLRAAHVVAASAPHAIYAYGTVSLNALCHGVLDGDCDSGTRHLDGGKSFHYVLLTGVNEPSDPFTTQIGAAKIACRSITLTYISDSQDSTNTYLELRQKGAKTQKHTSSSSKVGTFTASLTGAKFGVDVTQDAAQVFMYFNGHASCYSKTGKA